MKTMILGFVPYAYESITVADAAISLTSATYDQVGYNMQAFITLETAQVRWRIDGTDPTSSEGHLLEAGQNLTLQDSQAVKNFRAIRTGATSGVMKVTYLKG